MSNDDLRLIEMNGHTTSTAHRLANYQGVCSNIHGHNMEWDVQMWAEVPDDNTNMAVDFKDVKEVVDRYDHAILLNKEDPAVLRISADRNITNAQARKVVAEMLGRVFWFNGDPTCEHLTEVVADKYLEMEEVAEVSVSLSETDKYQMTQAGAVKDNG